MHNDALTAATMQDEAIVRLTSHDTDFDCVPGLQAPQAHGAPQSPGARILSPGEKVTDSTTPMCSRKTPTSRPVSISLSDIMGRRQPMASRRPRRVRRIIESFQLTARN